jgi:hypothetical protein
MTMAISPEPPKIPVGTSGRRRWRWLGRLVAGLAVLAVLLAVVLVVPRLLYPPLTNRELDRQGVTDGKERIELKREQDKLQNDARGALLQGLGGAVLLLGAYFTWRQLSVTREGQLTERFTRAVDQLGSDHVDVRLGGIYALERIARDSDIDRATIGEVLTAYVRGHAPWPPAQKGQLPADTPVDDVPWLQQRAPDVQAAVTVLGRGGFAAAMETRPLDLSRVDLRRADLRRADLSNAQLQRSNLSGARLSDANLSGAQLPRAYLLQAGLHGANLDGASLMGAHADRTTGWPAGFEALRAGVHFIVDEASSADRPTNPPTARRDRYRIKNLLERFKSTGDSLL